MKEALKAVFTTWPDCIATYLSLGMLIAILVTALKDL